MADQPTTDQRAPWAIRDEGAADWALRRAAHYRQQIAAVEERERAEIARVKAAAADHSRGMRRKLAWLEERLEDWHRGTIEAQLDELRAAGHQGEDAWKRVDGKTVTLPYGRVQAQRRKPKARVVNERAFIDWALKNNPALLKVEASQDAINKAPWTLDERTSAAVTAEGEMVPGVSVLASHVHISVQPSKEEQPAWLPDPDGWSEDDAFAGLEGEEPEG